MMRRPPRSTFFPYTTHSRSLLAVDEVELKAPIDPYSLLVGKQDGTVKLTVSAAPDGKRRDLVVQPVKNELPLRQKEWIEHNRSEEHTSNSSQLVNSYAGICL